MKRQRLNPRKLLIASAGVATVNYVFAAGCGGKEAPGYEFVANLMPPAVGGSLGGFGGPPSFGGTGGVYQGGVANLVAPPPLPSPSPMPPPANSSDADVPDAAGADDAGLDAG
jgi:hypothetical protein